MQPRAPRHPTSGQSEDTHSPDECAKVVVRRISPAPSSIEVVCTVAISWRPNDLRTRSKPVDNDAYRKVRSPSRGNGERIVALSDFSGLASSIWALASAPAIAPMVSLERCMGRLRLLQIKTDGAGFRTFGPDSVPNRFLGVLRHQLLELGFRRVVFGMGAAGLTKHACE